MVLAERIKRLGQVYAGRLPLEVLSAALEYVDFSENALAIEMLCDHLGDYGVAVTRSEITEIRELAIETGADLKRLEFLKGLVRDD